MNTQAFDGEFAARKENHLKRGSYQICSLFGSTSARSGRTMRCCVCYEVFCEGEYGGDDSNNTTVITIPVVAAAAANELAAAPKRQDIVLTIPQHTRHRTSGRTAGATVDPSGRSRWNNPANPIPRLLLSSRTSPDPAKQITTHACVGQQMKTAASSIRWSAWLCETRGRRFTLKGFGHRMLQIHVPTGAW